MSDYRQKRGQKLMDFLDECELSYEKMVGLWAESNVPVNRPSWDEYFMAQALLLSTRSLDAQTRYGCVLVKDNRVVGTGYNSWPRGLDDTLIPNVRPFKYDFVIHSELNALLNSTVENLEGAKCYVNGRPCLECLKALFQKGIKDFVITKHTANMVSSYTENQKAAYYYIVKRGLISFKEIEVSPAALEAVSKVLSLPNGV